MAKKIKAHSLTGRITPELMLRAFRNEAQALQAKVDAALGVTPHPAV